MTHRHDEAAWRFARVASRRSDGADDLAGSLPLLGATEEADGGVIPEGAAVDLGRACRCRAYEGGHTKAQRQRQRQGKRSRMPPAPSRPMGTLNGYRQEGRAHEWLQTKTDWVRLSHSST